MSRLMVRTVIAIVLSGNVLLTVPAPAVAQSAAASQGIGIPQKRADHQTAYSRGWSSRAEAFVRTELYFGPLSRTEP